MVMVYSLEVTSFKGFINWSLIFCLTTNLDESPSNIPLKYWWRNTDVPNHNAVTIIQHIIKHITFVRELWKFIEMNWCWEIKIFKSCVSIPHVCFLGEMKPVKHINIHDFMFYFWVDKLFSFSTTRIRSKLSEYKCMNVALSTENSTIIMDAKH